jgi:hypothetical protein
MTRAQHEREKARLARQHQLDLLAEAERNSNPVYVIGAAGYWLRLWQRSRSITMGRKRRAA